MPAWTKPRCDASPRDAPIATRTRAVKRVDLSQKTVGRRHGLRRVERIDRQACLIVFRIRNLLVCVPANSMLGRKERHKLHVASILQNVDRLTSFSIAACVIRH